MNQDLRTEYDIIFFTLDEKKNIEVNAAKGRFNSDGKMVALYKGTPAIIDEGLWIYRGVWNKLTPYMYKRSLEIANENNH